MTPESVKSELALFENPEFGKVRVVLRDGEPWFVASDVATALGYANPSAAVNQHCKKAIKTAFNANHVDGSTPPININLIPESDMYRLVMRSNAPKAEEFQTWVCEEVLPSIRKTGSYSVDSAALVKKEVTPSRAQALRYFYEEVCGIEGPQLAIVMDRAWRNLEGIAPLAIGNVMPKFTDDDDRGLYDNVTNIAKQYGQNARTLNLFLTEKGLQTRTDKPYKVEKDGEVKEKVRYEYWPTELGKELGGKRLPDSAKGNVNKDVWVCLWQPKKLMPWLDKFWKRVEKED